VRVVVLGKVAVGKDDDDDDDEEEETAPNEALVPLEPAPNGSRAADGIVDPKVGLVDDVNENVSEPNAEEEEEEDDDGGGGRGAPKDGVVAAPNGEPNENADVELKA